MNELHDQPIEAGDRPEYWAATDSAGPHKSVKKPAWFLLLMAFAIITIAVCGASLVIRNKHIPPQYIGVVVPQSVDDAVQQTQSQCLSGKTMVDSPDVRVRFDKGSRLPCMASAMILQGVLERSHNFRLKKLVNFPVHTLPEMNAVCSEVINHVIVCTSPHKSALWIFPEGIKA